MGTAGFFSCVPYADTYANGTLSLSLYNEKWCKLNSEKKRKKNLTQDNS